MSDILIQGSQELPYHKQRGAPKPVLQLKNGVVVNTYSSISEAARCNNISTSNISDVVHGFNNQTHGYEWKFADYTIPPELRRKRTSNPLKPCRIVFEKDFESRFLAQGFIDQHKILKDAKIKTIKKIKKESNND